MNVNINDNLNLSVPAGTKLRDGLSNNKIFLPSACGGRAICGFCKVKVISGAGELTAGEINKLSAEDIENQIRLACQVTIERDLKIVIPEDLISIKEYQATVESIIKFTDEIYQFRFKLDQPKNIDFKPGQYIHFYAPKYGIHHEEAQRAYSISSNPSESDVIELVVRRAHNGICTTYLFDILKAGDKVQFNGPHGKFVLSPTTAPIVMIAGGSGIAPMKSMLHQIQNQKLNRKIKFFFGLNYENEIFMQDVIDKFKKELPNFEFIPVIANPSQTWTGQSGMVTEAVARLCPDLSQSEAYLCGGPGMINACITVLTAANLPKDKIYYDEF